MASPNFKTGRYSKHLPAGLMERVREAERDPELLSARGEIALVTARIGELAQRLHGGEAGSLWRDLQGAVRDFDAAYAAQDAGGVNSSLNRIRRLASTGATEEERWAELVEMCETRTRLARAEWTRLVDLKQMLTAERASIFVMTILDAVLRHVPEGDRRARIGLELDSIMQGRGRKYATITPGAEPPTPREASGIDGDVYRRGLGLPPQPDFNPALTAAIDLNTLPGPEGLEDLGGSNV